MSNDWWYTAHSNNPFTGSIHQSAQVAGNGMIGPFANKESASEYVRPRQVMRGRVSILCVCVVQENGEEVWTPVREAYTSTSGYVRKESKQSGS